MNNDNNDFRKMKENLANKRNIILHHMIQNVKENQTLPQLGNMKAFTENKIRLKNNQEVF